MSGAVKFTGFLLAGALCLPVAGLADTQNTPQHRIHKTAKKPDPPPAPLPNGPQGPVPQVPLDAMPAVPPQVTYQDGLLTIVAPNSTLGDILKSVRKQTSADIEVPSNASERVVTRLGPAPAREVMAELLNGSKFNYILLGSAENANSLVRVVLVAKTPDTPASQAKPEENSAAVSGIEPAEAADDEKPDDSPDDQQGAESADSDQPANQDQPTAKTPQQMLQEMQQRQMQMQQQGQQPGSQQPGQPPYFPGRPGTPNPPQPQQQQNQ